MKYLKAFYFIAKVAALLAVLLGGCKLLFATCAALDPMLDAVLAWLTDLSGVIAVVIVIGFVLWIFADVCDKQRREERGR
jgi:protein-S-isoprenylcysteine O-methyltransferase Ste14